MQCSNVDFPDPEGPMIAVRRPASKPMVTSSRAVTSVTPRPYTFVAAAARAATAVAGLVDPIGASDAPVEVVAGEVVSVEVVAVDAALPAADMATLQR